MQVRDIMTPDPECVTPEQPISRAASIMRDCDIGVVPVVKNETDKSLVGLITDRDIAIRHVADSHRGDCRVGDHMTRENIETVRDTDDSATVLEAMKRREVRRIPVTDERGALVGIVAQADIATARQIPKDEVGEVVESISEPPTRRGAVQR